ncbi:peroxiredoxin [Xanthocytophaga flava]|uniref:peroxiredoxin n=1 Tax=Xanthocytophaga flava TaxID=3048013 RepID=UPI0028D7F8C2|nr:peroxiredoxin [Xanthocytophaga flavus]MDJ1471226.1 peroxiredoxin [Xanthocytophaga flavus]
MALQKGDKAPFFKLVSSDFKSANSDKKEVSLDDYKGKNLVVLFFPLAFSSVCTAELCSMRDDIGEYTALNAEVVAISVDSPYVLDRFKKDQSLTFLLLSDFNKEVSTAYGALYENFAWGMKGVSKRSAFVIDGDGVIQYAEVLENAGDVPDFDAIKKVLDELTR